MPTDEPDALAIATEARDTAKKALDKATEAMGVAEGAKSAVAGFGHDVRRCTNEVADLKKLSTEHHQKTMDAIEGAKATDAKQAADIADARKSLAEAQAAVDQGKKDLAAVKGDISSTALMKIAGAVAGTIGVIGAAVAGLIVALTPVAPKILEAKYAQPVVIVPAPSASPAVSR